MHMRCYRAGWLIFSGRYTYGYDQAYRVAWRNILDWVQAQMALLEIGMAKMEEIFLPYMLDRKGRTFFERMEQRGFLLDSGKVQEEQS